KKNQKEKSSSLKIIWAMLTLSFSRPALRFSLLAGLAELGLFTKPSNSSQAFIAINCDAH
ncbi:MAG: hypothetical protein Q8O74_02695, partial [bacterium]|nr:hypothetical protein [bacterium]